MTPNAKKQHGGTPDLPGQSGRHHWFNPSFSPETGLFYVNARENYSTLFVRAIRSMKKETGTMAVDIVRSQARYRRWRRS